MTNERTSGSEVTRLCSVYRCGRVVETRGLCSVHLKVISNQQQLPLPTPPHITHNSGSSNGQREVPNESASHHHQQESGTTEVSLRPQNERSSTDKTPAATSEPSHVSMITKMNSSLPSHLDTSSDNRTKRVVSTSNQTASDQDAQAAKRMKLAQPSNNDASSIGKTTASTSASMTPLSDAFLARSTIQKAANNVKGCQYYTSSLTTTSCKNPATYSCLHCSKLYCLHHGVQHQDDLKAEARSLLAKAQDFYSDVQKLSVVSGIASCKTLLDEWAAVMHAKVDQVRDEVLTTLEEINKGMEQKEEQWKTYLSTQLERSVGSVLTDEIQKYESDGAQIETARLEFLRLQKAFEALDNQQSISLSYNGENQMAINPPLIIYADLLANGLNSTDNFDAMIDDLPEERTESTNLVANQSSSVKTTANEDRNDQNASDTFMEMSIRPEDNVAESTAKSFTVNGTRPGAAISTAAPSTSIDFEARGSATEAPSVVVQSNTSAQPKTIASDQTGSTVALASVKPVTIESTTNTSKGNLSIAATFSNATSTKTVTNIAAREPSPDVFSDQNDSSVDMIMPTEHDIRVQVDPTSVVSSSTSTTVFPTATETTAAQTAPIATVTSALTTTAKISTSDTPLSAEAPENVVTANSVNPSVNATMFAANSNPSNSLKGAAGVNTQHLSPTQSPASQPRLSDTATSAGTQQIGNTSSVTALPPQVEETKTQENEVVVPTETNTTNHSNTNTTKPTSKMEGKMAQNAHIDMIAARSKQLTNEHADPDNIFDIDLTSALFREEVIDAFIDSHPENNNNDVPPMTNEPPVPAIDSHTQQIPTGTKGDLKLDLSHKELTDADMPKTVLPALQKNESGRRIVACDLSNNKISEEGAKHLGSALQYNNTLMALGLHGNKIENAGVQHLSDALSKNKKLFELDISENQISFLGMQYLSTALKMNNVLTILNLDNNHIGAKGTQYLSDGIGENNALKTLKLNCCHIEESGTHVLCEVLKTNTSITTLELSSNRIGEKGALYVGTLLRANKAITVLNLRCNQTGETGAFYVADALRVNTTLVDLNIERNQIRDIGVKHISDVLRHNKTLVTLNLSNNLIGHMGAEYVSNMLQINKTLKDLDFSFNGIKTIGARFFSDAIRKNKTLTRLSLQHNRIADQGLTFLKDAVKENKVLVTCEV